MAPDFSNHLLGIWDGVAPFLILLTFELDPRTQVANVLQNRWTYTLYSHLHTMQVDTNVNYTALQEGLVL